MAGKSVHAGKHDQNILSGVEAEGVRRKHKGLGVGHQMKRIAALLFFILATNAIAQNMSVRDFVIDHSKPYVYLKFDHIGPRKPIQNGEGNTGLWLRVINNCRIPIVFASFNMPAGDPGVGLMDEVVETEPMMQIFATPGERKETQRQEALRRSKHKPEGYSFETAGVVRVQPGANILFSVPLNHVDDDWYMRVRFALDLDKSSVSVGPFTYLPFYEWDIPKELRQTHAAQPPSSASPDAETKPGSPHTVLLHESGHPNEHPATSTTSRPPL